MSTDGSEQKSLTPVPSDADEKTRARWSNGVPSGSPDSSRIAFSSARSGQTEIWVMNADGSEARSLLPFSYGAGRLASAASAGYQRSMRVDQAAPCTCCR